MPTIKRDYTPKMRYNKAKKLAVEIKDIFQDWQDCEEGESPCVAQSKILLDRITSWGTQAKQFRVLVYGNSHKKLPHNAFVNEALASKKHALAEIEARDWSHYEFLVKQAIGKIDAWFFHADNSLLHDVTNP